MKKRIKSNVVLNSKLNKYELIMWTIVLNKDDRIIPVTFNREELEKKVSDIVLAKELLNL